VRQVSPPISTEMHVTPYIPPLAVDVTFLDLPMLKSDQIAHAPSVAADFEHLAIRTSRTTKGALKFSLSAGVHSRLQHLQSFDVLMSSGQLHSVLMLQMLNGSNTAATGNPSQIWDGFDFFDLVSYVGTLGGVNMDQ
jgi:hypothetical protein